MSDELDTPLDADRDAEERADRNEAWLTAMANGEMERVRGYKHDRHTWPAPPLADLLAFEEQHPGHTGPKEDAIRKAFGGMNTTRYYQCLNAAIDTPEALELKPMLVNRLRDLRTRRTEARATRTLRRTTR